jgi:hypothetical protein
MPSAITSARKPATVHVHDDPRFVAAAKRYSSILDERDDLRNRYEQARLLETSSQPQTTKDAAERYLAGESKSESQPSASLWADLCIREEALKLQQQAMRQIECEISRELSAAEKPKHDALAARLNKALREAKDADAELSAFLAGLTNRGVSPTYPVLAFVPARESGGIYSIDDWLTKYRQYAG